jgi:hypothetical protein
MSEQETDDCEFDDYEDGELDAFEEALMNCGLVGNTGLCMKAGSEECDWDCPFNR